MIRRYQFWFRTLDYVPIGMFRWLWLCMTRDLDIHMPNGNHWYNRRTAE